MPDHRSNSRRWLLFAVKLLVVVLVVWFIRQTIVGAWNNLRAHPRHVDWRWLAAAGWLYLFGSLFCGIFWHRILRTLGQRVSLTAALRAFYVGHLGKYVPGKAMVFLIRAGMIRGPGVDPSLAVVSVFLETLTMMSVGSLAAAAVVAGCLRDRPIWFLASIVMLAAAGLPTLPPVFRRLVRLAGFGKIDPATLAKLDAVGYKTIFLGWALNLIGWIALGLSYWAVLKSLGIGGDTPWRHLHLYVASVSLATVAGFVSFVPSGAVVREGVLTTVTELMFPQFGGTVALLGAVLLRLTWLAAELFMAGVLLLGTRGEGNKTGRLGDEETGRREN
jgi:uncharacterized membrane protein YbhN (UPF0104 family)